MALADAVQNARRPSQLITWTDADGAPLDLSGATITARVTRNGVTTASDGVFVVMTAASGIFRWEYGVVDVATEGFFDVQFTATFGTAPTRARSLAMSWQVYKAN